MRKDYNFLFEWVGEGEMPSLQGRSQLCWRLRNGLLVAARNVAPILSPGIHHFSDGPQGESISLVICEPQIISDSAY